MLKLRNRHLSAWLIILFAMVFLLQYYFIVSYIEEMFQYTTDEVRNMAMNNEMREFKFHLIETIVLLILQGLGAFFCLNIGLLYFKLKVTISEVMKLILFSFFAILIHQFLTLIIIELNGWTYTIGSMSSVSEILGLSHYINAEKTAPWIKLSLMSINLTQLLTLIALSIGIYKIFRLNYKRAFLISLRTYGLGILIWFVFAMIMEMNFS